MSGTFPGSPKSISEQLVISPTRQGLVFLEQMARQYTEGAVQGPLLEGCAQEPRVT